MDTASLPDLLDYQELADIGLTRRRLTRLIEAETHARAKPLTIWTAPIAWHRFDTKTFEIGRTQHALPDGKAMGLDSAERTIIDLFRLSHLWGSDFAVGALKRWLGTRGNSPSVLLTLAKDFSKGADYLAHTPTTVMTTDQST